MGTELQIAMRVIETRLATLTQSARVRLNADAVYEDLLQIQLLQAVKEDILAELATLQRGPAPSEATDTPDLGYKWDPERRNWYPIEADDGC